MPTLHQIDYTPIHQAVMLLTERDEDFAASENARGWNRFDAKLGHALANKPWERWTDVDLHAAWKMVRKYAITQLTPAGIDVRRVPEPPQPIRDRDPERDVRRFDHHTYPNGFAKVRMSEDGQTFVITFGGVDPHWGARQHAVAQIPGAKFDRDAKLWAIPVTIASVDGVATLIARSQRWDVPFAYDPMLPFRLDAVVKSWGAKIRESEQAVGDIDVANLASGQELRPFQKAGVAWVLEHRRTLIADEMGLGKTVQAIASIIAADAFPALIICPATLKANWRREFERWSGRPLRIHMAQGRKDPSFPADTDILICNYDIVHDWRQPLGQRHWQAVVLDESHYVKTSKAQRTKAVRAVINETDPSIRLLLSGTPVLNRPIELWSQLDILGYGEHPFAGWRSFANRYCGPVKGYAGSIDYKGATNLEEMNQILRCGIMIRRLKKDVLTELPPKQWATVPMEFTKEGAKEYTNAASNLAQWIGERKAENDERRAAWRAAGFEQGLKDGDLADYIEKQAKAYASTETARAAASEQLLRFTVLKQLAFKAKQKSIFDWIDNFLMDDRKLVVFGWHREAVDAIAERYDAPKIQGGMKSEDVEQGKDRFMTDPECRVIVCNLAAGGVGHTLTAASDVAFVEFGWNPALMDQASDRVHRIGQQAESVTAWQLVGVLPDGSDTIDGEIAEIIAQKRKVVSDVTDGLGVDTQSSMMAELTKRMFGKED